MNKKGHLYVIAAPSGAGKTSLVHALVEHRRSILISISYTTRPARPGDRDGVDYHFVSEQQFKEMVDQKEFLEHAMVFGHRYGTGRKWVLEQLAVGNDVILEIDWQGARQIKQQFRDAIGIFILPPSRQALYDRLRSRRQDDAKVIAQRMRENTSEMTHYVEFDYLIVNEAFEHALEDLIHIVCAERLRLIDQQSSLQELVAELLKKD